ncbi:polysaccharide pyruvyl transferase family protein [Spirosoma horti]
MKIGIMTFHWGTNYGGVLQAYALQQFIKNNIKGSEVCIINYAPKTHIESLYKCVATKHIRNIKSNLITYFKEKNFVHFRKKYLLTTKRYYSLDDLNADYPDFDIYICGSDQIWNPYIISEKASPYFLSFGKASTKRISYAVSFGCTDYPIEKMQLVKPYIQNFDAISVRENSGIDILKNEGILAQIMPDPTLLLSYNDLYNLIPRRPPHKDDYYFSYALQKNQILIKNINQYVKIKKNIKIVNTKNLKSSMLSIESWLSNIRNSKFVITNSFHGVVFSILFQKPFVAIPVEGKHKGMNDRIYTLLNKFQLSDRILTHYDEDLIENIIKNKINWTQVLEMQEELQKLAFSYLDKNII